MATGGTTVIFCSACGTHNAPDARFCQACGQAMTPVQPVPVTASIAAYAAHPYGGFWIRLVAWLIDMIIVGVVIPIAFALLPLFHFIGFGVGFFTWWLYEAFLTSSSMQATVGKKLLGMRVTDVHGNQLTFARATGRHFAKYISAFILGVGYLMIAFTEKKQGLHDMLAGTLVQKTR